MDLLSFWTKRHEIGHIKTQQQLFCLSKYFLLCRFGPGSLTAWHGKARAATAGKAPKAWALPRFWVSIRSYKKQPVKKNWGRILDLAWLKFAVTSLKCKELTALIYKLCYCGFLTVERLLKWIA